jgi:hypothetical protein
MHGTLFAAALVACGSDPEGTPNPTPVPNDAGVPAEDGGSLPDAGTDAANYEPPVACGTALPGETMRAGLVEAEPGYAAALAMTDTSAVPDPFDYRGESALFRGVINYMLERAAGDSLTRASAMAAQGMGAAVLAAAAKGQGGRLDFAFLRRGLHYHYPCSRPLPASLNALRTRYGIYENWTRLDIACAKPKNGPRRIYENGDLGVYIAETLVAGSVRETEVIFSKTRNDGQLDFAVYTPEGDFTDRSTFATGNGGAVTSASPYTCMSCHIEPGQGRFTVRFPTGTGAGCR